MRLQKLLFVACALLLAGQTTPTEANGQVCLNYWEDDGPQRLILYVGQEDVGYGEFCYRAEMIVGNGVMGSFCIDVGVSGDMEFDLHGSSYYGGKDCYAAGYIDPVPQWSHTCHLVSTDKYEARIQSVGTQFCNQ